MKAMQRNSKIFELGVSIMLFCLAGFLIYVANTTGMPASDGMSSMDFPRGIFVVMMILCAYVGVNSVFWFMKHPKTAEESSKPKEPMVKRKAVLTFIFICIYALLWNVIGFSLSTFVFFTVESRMLDSKRPLKWAIIIGLGAMVLMYLVFGVLFKVQFPEPILEMVRGY